MTLVHETRAARVLIVVNNLVEQSYNVKINDLDRLPQNLSLFIAVGRLMATTKCLCSCVLLSSY